MTRTLLVCTAAALMYAPPGHGVRSLISGCSRASKLSTGLWVAFIPRCIQSLFTPFTIVNFVIREPFYDSIEGAL